ncbi:murein L,D-transpeptidase catalytic domain family protein [Flavobacterium myungsuense]|uniref:Murein L,D-transpeptidase catalytic domain family protein n=1 Tax=Flavobacterium myungsuense TaxID=651823 RepID=A0ABW3J248_9FLAO
MIYKTFPLLIFLLLSFASNHKKEVKMKLTDTTVVSEIDTKVKSVYFGLNSNNLELPKIESFSEALKGFYLLKEKGIVKKDVLTLIDFSLSSNTKRLWVIDLVSNKILYHSLVAHGRNTGEEFATSFSNHASSFKSSLGFYLTGEIYQGKHGSSLKLDGLEKGLNDNARERGIVMHAANYVSSFFIKNNNRLGRSQGCPAIPVEYSNQIINAIKNKSCLFIYHPTINSYKSLNLIS